MAHQRVVVEQTKVAELEANREEQRLQAAVRKPADAHAYEQTTLARAQRDAKISAAEADARQMELAAQANAVRVRSESDAKAQQIEVLATAEAESTRKTGDANAHAKRSVGAAEADALRARGLAEAESIKARAEALAANQDAVIGQQLAEQWPAIVEAAAKPFGAIDQLIVLNGAAGLGDALAQALSQGASALQLARTMIGGLGGPGAAAPGLAKTTSQNGSSRTADGGRPTA
jgi:uncharacterized membrane protein YqiK